MGPYQIMPYTEFQCDTICGKILRACLADLTRSSSYTGTSFVRIRSICKLSELQRLQTERHLLYFTPFPSSTLGGHDAGKNLVSSGMATAG